MENLFDTISEDLKSAMKQRQKVRLDALRYVKKLLIENKTSKKPRPEIDVMIAYNKQLSDSLEAYPKDSDHYTKIEEEISHLKIYLPTALEENEVIEIISQIKGSQESPNLGTIMRELSPQIKGKFNGKRASELVREALA